MRKLKKPIQVSGQVIKGDKQGRLIGFPTANLKPDTKLNIKPGVYASICKLKKNSYLGMAYYGPRFIFNQKINSFEVYLFNFNQNIYHQKLKVKLTHFVRPPVKLTSLKQIKNQLTKDRQNISKNQMVLVNQKDQITGQTDLLTAHQNKGRLHRAISVYIFNSKKELLVQKRSRQKSLWPNHWSNTVCSHPYVYETYQECANRRLYQELCLKAKLKPLKKITYRFIYQNIGAENELTQVFIGFSDQKPNPNSKEVASIKYLSLSKLKKEINKQSNKYTPWFKKIIKILS